MTELIRIRNLTKVTPDTNTFASFTDELRVDMETETEMFFRHIQLAFLPEAANLVHKGENDLIPRHLQAHACRAGTVEGVGDLHGSAVAGMVEKFAINRGRIRDIARGSLFFSEKIEVDTARDATPGQFEQVGNLQPTVPTRSFHSWQRAVVHPPLDGGNADTEDLGGVADSDNIVR